MADDAADAPGEPIRFRTNKKRKTYRQRESETQSASASASAADIPIAPPPAATLSPRDSIARSFGEDPATRDQDDRDDQELNPDESEEEDGDDDAQHAAAAAESAAAAALRLRNSHRSARLRGMGFKSDAPSARSDNAASSSSTALVTTASTTNGPSSSLQALAHKGPDGGAQDPATASAVDGRFMHQTGLLTILDDVHMNEYIEARLASRNAKQRPPNSRPRHADQDDENDDNDDDDHNGLNHSQTQVQVSGSGGPARAAHQGIHNRAKDHQPARQGKLFEVSIPDDVRRDKADKDKDKDKAKDADPSKRPRDKRRRNSDDIQRDAMVDQFLHENRLAVYDVAEASTSRYAPGRDYSADARLAEQFRRQYYEDLASRRKKRRPPLTKKEQEQRAAQASEVLKGPKLGGSRNQRAAIRNILLQQQSEKKG